MGASDAPVLLVENLTVTYGKIVAVSDINLEVRRGELVTLIGANGSGKSTLLRTVIGLKRATSGSICFIGQDITQMPVERIVALGITMAPEGGDVLPEMTVIENLELGAYHKDKRALQENLESVFIRFPILRERKARKAAVLSGGEKQMLGLGRAMMGTSGLMLVDEPSFGLAPIIVDEVFSILADMREDGYTILLAAQNAEKALRCADRGYVLRLGKIVADGTARQLMNNAQVREAYLSSGKDEPGERGS